MFMHSHSRWQGCLAPQIVAKAQTGKKAAACSTLLQLTYSIVVVKEGSILHVFPFLLATVLANIEVPCSVA